MPLSPVVADDSSSASSQESQGGVNTVNTKKDTSPSDKYTLLAPFAGFTEAPNTIGEYVNKIFIVAIGLCGFLAFLMLVIAGVQYMVKDTPFAKGSAKGQISNAIFGLLIALSAYALLNTLDPRLLGKEGLNVKAVSLSIDEEQETDPWTGYSSSGNLSLCKEGFTDVSTYGTPEKINVCKTIAVDLKKLIDKAKKENIILSGSGTRDSSQQRLLRIKNGCPDDSTPSKECHPPTARPGFSMHESGLAIDFNCNGKTMKATGGKNSDCYVWLSKNAGSLFKNLKSEPWHWSTTGK